MRDYNPSFDTPLGDLEPMYRAWKKQQAPTDESGTYDYRGAFLEEMLGRGTRDSVTGHWTDKFKEPNYPTFSSGSQYAGAYPERAGTWEGDTFIPARGLQRGSGNVNHVEMFKRFQRLQGGTDEVYHRDELFFRPGHKPSSKEASRLYDPGPLKTVEVNINGKKMEVPLLYEGMTPEHAEDAARMRLEWGLDPFATDDELEAKQNAAHMGPDDASLDPNSPNYNPPQQYAEGTGNVNLNYDPSYPGPTNPHESGSGYWTQRLVGTGVGTASNFFVPGLGLLTGPIASWAMRAMQSGMSQNAVQNAVRAYQTSQTPSGQSGDTTTAPAADDGSNVTAPVNNAPPSAGIGIDPFGNPADPGEFWSNDFGRWGEGDQYGTTPGNYNPPGPGGVAGTRGVWGGQTTIPIASDPNFTPSLGWAMPAASGGGAYGGNTMAKIALHSGTFRDAATPEQWAFMQNYLSGGGGGGGGGQGVGGAGRPMTQSVQMGTSSVNPGLKLFHAIQKRKKQ